MQIFVKTLTGKTITLEVERRQQRSLWTRVSSGNSTLKSCIDDCFTQQQQQQQQQQPSICFALFSKSFASQEYNDAIKYLNKQFPKTTSVMGCVVDRTASDHPQGHGISLLFGYNEHIQPFQVQDSPQRHKARSISVGRWGQVYDFDRFKYQDNSLDTMGWLSFDTISQPPQQHVDVFLAGSQPPSFILMASDHEPDQVLTSLDTTYPDTPKYGILGASTPFLTGSPYTMFYQDRIMEAGMIGFASYSSSSSSSSSLVHYPCLEPLGSSLQITRARGNIILDLDDQGATRLLLQLINQVNVSKDEAFYLGIYQDDENMTVARITSGDPGRGNMAVDTTLDLQQGQRVQFMKTNKSHLTPQQLLTGTQDHTMVFGVVDLDHTIDTVMPLKESMTTTTTTNTFGATSENGMIVGNPGRPSQLHQVPFSFATIDHI
ncbi:uncharacterized protein BX664DRAFT_388996 [Halteromyces radiatus]|uniref:uncharacterized protein n=1 Tax=Halteromyces radiatus TaxID=101107 RepID=UPI00222046AD|nr:uncharacterized protein BX664DRAFT_388996 [Halteromyces radiatus]KAI8080053.1 hypothetical protein BX664DRAFT_388996 [Halteromyces radiatus]